MLQQDPPVSDFGSDWIINFPLTGSVFSTGVGTNTFDFSQGKVTRYDGVNTFLADNLTTLRKDLLKTLYLWSDVDCTVRFFLRGKQSGLIDVDQCTQWAAVHVPFDRFDVTHSLPGNFEFTASTSLFDWASQRITSHQMRFSSGSTVDAMTPVQWQATDASGARSNAAAQYTSSTLHIPSLKTKTFLVFNTHSTNSLNVNLQAKGDSASTNWLDDPSTGSSTTIAAGNSAKFTTTDAYHLLRLRLQSTVAGNSASYEVHYIALSA